jgi:D-alanine transaminase
MWREHMITYFNGQLLPKESVHISPDDRGFVFADGVYEVIHVYRGQLFATEQHLRRLANSLSEVRIAWPDIQRLPAIARELVKVNGLDQSDGLVYVQITRGVAPRLHPFPDESVPPTVYATASPVEPVPEHWERGIKVILVPDIRWGRCDIKSLALLSNVLAAQEAKERGADEAIFVRDGVITEGARTNVAAVVDGVLVTHPRDHRILPGITRNVVLELCQHLGIPVRESPLAVIDLPRVEELMILGTTKEVTPVVRVDEITIGDGLPGPIAQRLERAYRDLIGAL